MEKKLDKKKSTAQVASTTWMANVMNERYTFLGVAIAITELLMSLLLIMSHQTVGRFWGISLAIYMLEVMFRMTDVHGLACRMRKHLMTVGEHTYSNTLTHPHRPNLHGMLSNSPELSLFKQVPPKHQHINRFGFRKGAEMYFVSD